MELSGGIPFLQTFIESIAFAHAVWIGKETVPLHLHWIHSFMWHSPKAEVYPGMQSLSMEDCQIRNKF